MQCTETKQSILPLREIYRYEIQHKINKNKCADI